MSEQVGKESWREPSIDGTKSDLPEIVEQGSKRTATMQQRAMRKQLNLEDQNGQVWGEERSHGFLQPNVKYAYESVSA